MRKGTGEETSWTWGDERLSNEDNRIILLGAGHGARNDEEKIYLVSAI